MNIAFVKLDDSLRIIMSGYLWKLSRSMVPTTTPGCASALVSKWSRRFFVLRADSCLYFFKKEQVNLTKNIIYVTMKPEPKPGLRYLFLKVGFDISIDIESLNGSYYNPRLCFGFSF